ncbi:ABC transporter substrate-binding protein [Bacillus sp. FJAT-27251]|uniref:ABC transporter substrate-binding protein n=1 Tax=Bacillus sp. FJAT-27251 TaxID=1684142 RepID=UPI0006A7CB45|nr:ABC transporter substrate-binding protein [Bacillus sp. FJAT-27251]
MDRFHISATGHSVNYFPEYLARDLGYYADVDLDVTAEVPQPWPRVLKDIDSGVAQAALGGIWVPSIYKNHVKDYYAFAQVSARCPMVLVSRTPIEKFSWSILEDKIVIVSGGNGASPFLFLEGCLKEAGYDLSKSCFVHDFATPMIAECFAGGWGDMIVVDPLTASTLVMEGKGYLAGSLAEYGGAVPWSVYYSPASVLEHEDHLAGRFTAALQRATTWIREHDATEAQDVVEKYWPNIDKNVVIGLISSFREYGMWDENVRIKENELSRWQGIITDAGLLNRPLKYDEIIDSRPFDYASHIISKRD